MGRGNLYTIDRRLGVRLENHDPSKTIRDVELALLSIRPDETYPMPLLLAKGLSINPGSHKMVPIARYLEPSPTNHPTSNICGDTVMLVAFSLDDPTTGIPAGLDNMLTLRATAADVPPEEKTIRVWVEGGRLRIAEVN